MKKVEAKTNGRTDARWHAAHPMPADASLDQRVNWHVAHRAHCACRPMPATVVADLERRGQLEK